MRPRTEHGTLLTDLYTIHVTSDVIAKSTPETLRTRKSFGASNAVATVVEPTTVRRQSSAA